MDTSRLGYFDEDLAIIIGVIGATIFNKLQWCVESPSMAGTVVDGQKWIRNPIKCTDPKKKERVQEHGKLIDWRGNFPFLSFYQIKSGFAKLEELGLVISQKLRAGKWDACKYYTIDTEKLAELLEPASLPICQNPSNRYVESQQIDLTTDCKSNQDTFSKKVIQKEPLTERASATVLVNLEIEENEESNQSNQSNVNFQVAKEVDSTTEPITLQVDKCSAPSSPVARKEFFEALLAYCYQRVDIDSPEGYANWVMRESKSRTPEASVAMLWDEFNAGEELGGRMVPPGFRLRGVPEQVVVEAISQDCIGKVGTTATEAAKSAAGQLRRLPVVAAVANAVKLQLERCLEGAKRQVELGVPKEQALLNNLPTYATNCTENSIPQIAASETVEMPETAATDPTNPYALTDENRAARNKAFEMVQAKLPRGRTKREQMLAANMADAAAFAKEMPFTKPKPVVEVVVEKPVEDDEPILW